MANKIKAIKTLYKAKRITLEGVRQAVAGAIITKKQYKEIIGKDYN